MTPKQKRFVDEYIIDLNATDAARRAGYSEKTARIQGPRQLSKDAVRSAIEAAQARRSKKTGITAERILQEYEAIGFSRHHHYLQSNDGGIALAEGAPEIAHGAISSVRRRTTVRRVAGKNGVLSEVEHAVEFKLWDKLNALEKMAKHVGIPGFVTQEPGPSVTILLSPELQAGSAKARHIALLEADVRPAE